MTSKSPRKLPYVKPTLTSHGAVEVITLQTTLVKSGDPVTQHAQPILTS